MLDLYHNNFDSPRRRDRIENLLNMRVYLFSFGKQFIELCLSTDAAQRDLRELGCREEIIDHLADSPRRIDHPKIKHGTDLNGDVVLRDNVLSGNFHCYRA